MTGKSKEPAKSGNIVKLVLVLDITTTERFLLSMAKSLQLIHIKVVAQDLPV